MCSTSITILSNEKQSYINEFRRQGMFCDVKIKVDDRTFCCHRVILASVMKYFRDMFTKNFTETQQVEIELKYVNADDFELLLNRVYDIPVNLSKGKNAYRLFRISHYLHLECLDELCAQYIANVNSIPLSTVIRIYRFVMRTDEEALSNSMAEYLAENFITAIQTCSDKLQRCSGDELLKIFTQPAFDKSTNVALLDFLTSWAKSQSSNDMKILPELLNFVDLTTVPKEWIVKMMDNSIGTTKKGIKRRYEDSCSLCETYLNELLIDTNPGSGQHATAITIPSFALYTLDNEDNDTRGKFTINKYQLGCWNKIHFLDLILNPLPANTHTIDFKAAVVDRAHIMVLNYYKNLPCRPPQQVLRPIACTKFGKYQLKELNLEKLDPRNLSKNKLTMATSGFEIYVYTSYSFHRYDCNIDSWSKNFEYFREPTYDSNLVADENILYLVGGLGKCITNGKLFQRYDKREKRSSWLSCTKYAHIRSASCIHNGALYVSGGEGLSCYNGYIEYFDFRAGKWNEFESSLPWPKFDHTLIAYDNKLWFFGGKCYEDPITTEPKLTWCSYDMNEHKWSDNHFIQTRVHKMFTIADIQDVVVQI